MSIKHELKNLFLKLGLDISRYQPIPQAFVRKKQIFESYAIDTVLDIGANAGQFAKCMRNGIGFNGRILSFEPLSTAFQLLSTNAKNDPTWEVFNFALGDTQEKREINIAANSQSSSFLDMLPSHLKSAPYSMYIGKETINIKTLDSIFGDLGKTAKNIFMKIDAQGYESKILNGAVNSLPLIDTVQLEMSLVPLYDGELLFNEMCSLMGEKGYALIEIERGFSDPSSDQLLQVDGIFHRL